MRFYVFFWHLPGILHKQTESPSITEDYDKYFRLEEIGIKST